MKYGAVILVFLCLAASCKTAKNQSSQESKTETKKETAANENLCRVRVSFGSIASGINRESMLAFQKYLGDYKEKTGKELSNTVTNWGMEGERDYCFKLLELSKKQQQEFIDGLLALSKEKQQLFVLENVEPRQPRRPPPTEE